MGVYGARNTDERRVNYAKGSRSAVTQSAQRAEQESPHCAIRSGALRSKGPAACRWTPLGVDEEPPHPTSDAALAPPPVSLGDVCFTQSGSHSSVPVIG